MPDSIYFCMMQLIVDVGNTRVKCAVFQEDEILDLRYFHHDEIKQFEAFVLDSGVKRGILSSVADPKIDIGRSLDVTQVKTLRFDKNTKLPITVNYDKSSYPGLDRVADAVAAFYFSEAKNTLIIDAGTCITYNYVIGDQYNGGAISPGLYMRYEALNTFTGRLPLIADRRHTDIIGNSTKNSIQSGVINGIIMEIQGLCDHFSDQYENTEILITGGDSIFFAEGVKNTIFADPLFTLKGLNKILAFNES